MNVWLCPSCNHEILSKEDPLYCEWCGCQQLKDLGPDEIWKKWRNQKDDSSAS